MPTIARRDKHRAITWFVAGFVKPSANESSKSYITISNRAKSIAPAPDTDTHAVRITAAWRPEIQPVLVGAYAPLAGSIYVSKIANDNVLPWKTVVIVTIDWM